jgi:hypothetical protein
MHEKPRLLILPVAMLLAMGGLLWAVGAFAQLPLAPERTGLLFKVQGNHYERRVYDLEGELIGRQLIAFDLMRFQDGECRLPVVLEVFEGADYSQIREEYQIGIQVECAEPHLIASLLVYKGDPNAQNLEIRIIGDGETYPSEPEDDQRLADVHLVFRLRKGFLSLLGTKTEMQIADRRVRIPTDGVTSSGAPTRYEILSSLEVRLYILGVPWKRERYTARQVVEQNLGLVEETLRRDDGTVSEVKLLPDFTEVSDESSR